MYENFSLKTATFKNPITTWLYFIVIKLKPVA